MAAKTKKGRTPTPGQGSLVAVQFRFEPSLLDAVDAKISEQNASRVLKLTRTDVVRLLLHDWLNESSGSDDGELKNPVEEFVSIWSPAKHRSRS